VADTYTTILNLTKFEVGSRNNTWGADFATDVLDPLDTAIAGVGTAITTTGGASSVTEDNARARVQRITGTLTSNATISLPANATWWIFSNETSGAYTVTLLPTSGAGITIPQGRRMLVIQSTTQAYGYVLGTSRVIDTAGTSTAYTATSGLALTAVPDGEMFLLRLDEDCGATPTLAVDGLTARTMKHADGSAIAPGDLKSASIYPVFYRSATTDFLVIGGPTRALANALTITVDDASNNAVTRLLTLGHTTSGTAAAGMGVGILARVEDAAGNLNDAGALDFVLTDATNGSEDSDVVVRGMVAGTLTEIFRALGTGGLQLLGVAAYTLKTIQWYTGSATWTRPTGCRAALVMCVGAGGGGGGANNGGSGASAGGGGGGGGIAFKLVTSPGSSETVTIGAAGTAGAAAAGTGGTGGTTSFGSHCVATGGAGGVGGSTGANNSPGSAGGLGGIGTTGDLLVRGGNGGNGTIWSIGASTAGFGGSSLGGTTLSQRDGSSQTAGNPYGGGGSGGATLSAGSALAGAVGSAGACIVLELY
jgi:hypothetical protein